MRSGSVCLWLVLWAAGGWGVLATEGQRKVEVVVHLGVTHQRMEGFGAAIMGWQEPPPYRNPAWYDALVNEMGVSIVRIPIPPDMLEPVNDDDDPDHFNWPAFKLGLPEGPPTQRTRGPSDPRPTQMDRVMQVALEFKKRGVQRFVASLWSPPGFMKTNRATVQGGHLRMDMVQEYAEFMAAFIMLAKKNYDIDIGAVSVQNELYFVEYYDSCIYTPTHLREAVRALGRKFRREGIRTRIMMPAEMMTVDRLIPYITPTMADPEASQYVGTFCMHRQGGFDEVIRWREATTQYGLQTWMTETSGHGRNWAGALRMASDMHDYITGGVSVWLYWMLTDVGAIADGRPGPKYHAARHFYRFVRPGALRVECNSSDEHLLASAFRHDADGTVSVVLINRAAAPAEVAVQVRGRPVPAAFQVIQSTEAAGSSERGTLPGGHLRLTMPPQSIVTLYGQDPALKTVAAVTPWPASVDVPADPQKWGNFDRTVLGEGYNATRAAEMNILDALQREIAGGRADVARTDGWTPLHWAALCGSSQAIRLLLDNGANVNKPADDGWTPLHAAAAAPFRTDNNNKRLPPDAAGVQIVEMLIARGADVNAVTSDGWTPLHAAAAASHVGWRGDREDQPNRVRVILAAGAAVDAPDINGRTPLHWAAWQGYTNGLTQTDTIVNVLLEAGADVGAVDNLGRTPLHYAADMGHDPIVRALVAAGADTSARDKEGKTPADLARAKQLTTTLKALAAPAAPRPAAATPSPAAPSRLGPELLQAARAGDVQRVRELIARGADISWMDSDGFRAVDRARDAGHEEVVRLLRQAEQRQEGAR